MSRRKASDRVEAVLRNADATLEKWFRRARKRSAGVLRQRVDGLQAGLKKLSTGLEHLERDPEAAPPKRRTRAVNPRKSSSPRRQKKAA